MNTFKSLLVAVSSLCTFNAEAQNTDFLEMVKYAVKAPSGHNTQPWKFRLMRSSIEVYPNFAYALPAVDPDNREMYISLGAAVENLCIAANHLGYSSTPSIKKEHEGTFKINIDLHKDTVTKDPLFSQIEKRQTNRSVYNGQLISEDTIDIIKRIRPEDNIAFYLFKKNDVCFNSLELEVENGNRIQMNDDAFKDELKNWIRFNDGQAEEAGDGLTNRVMGSPAVPGFLGKFIIGFFLKPEKQNKADIEKIESSSHFVLFTIKNDIPEEWISLGRSLERFLLKTTELGLANAYMNQPCEIPELSNRIRTNLPINNEYPVLLLRIGYSHAAAYSHRRLLEKAIMDCREETKP